MKELKGKDLSKVWSCDLRIASSWDWSYYLTAKELTGSQISTMGKKKPRRLYRVSDIP